MTSRGIVKVVTTLSVSFVGGTTPSTSSYPGIRSPTAADGDKRGLDDNSRDTLGYPALTSEPDMWVSLLQLSCGRG
jgi:hypothetical protein